MKIIKKLMMVTALTASLVMTTMTVSAAPQKNQTQSEVQYVTKASKTELAAIRKLFNAKEYAAMYPDVAAIYGDNEEALWNHFVNYGLAEGRALRKDFNVFAYRSAYRDLQEAFGNNLAAYYAHYANNGMREGRAIITIEKAAKAGVTVTGLRGQILAKPAPVAQNTGIAASTSDSASTSENSEASIPSQASSDESASMVSENPAPSSSTPASEPTKPEQPTPAPTPSEPEDPTPTPTPEPEDPAPTPSEPEDPTPTPTPEPEDPTPTPSEPDTCTHVWGCVKVDGENAHMPKCVICGATDPSQKEACTSAGKEGNATEHWSKCQYCFRIYDREAHTWENGICTVCNAPCSHESWSNGACTTCGKTCGHNWDPSTGKCNTCGAICKHDWNSENGVCNTCGKQCSHNSRHHVKKDEKTHEYICYTCKYTVIQDHKFNENNDCYECWYHRSTSY